VCRRRESGSGPGSTGKRGSSSGEVAQRRACQPATPPAAASLRLPEDRSDPSDAAQPDCPNAQQPPPPQQQQQQEAAPTQDAVVLPTEEQLPTNLTVPGQGAAVAAGDEGPDAQMPSADEAAGCENAGSDPDEGPAAATHEQKVGCLIC
jgi:hypothetical protein